MRQLTAGVLAGAAALLTACSSAEQGTPIESGPFMDKCPSGSLLSAVTGKDIGDAAPPPSPWPQSKPRYQGKLCSYQIHVYEEGLQPRATIYFTGTGTTADTVWRDLEVDTDLDLPGADTARTRDDGMTVFTVDGRVISTLVKDDLATAITLARVVLGTD